MQTNNNMQPAEALNILQTIAKSHPDFAQFNAEFAQAVDPSKTLPPEILPEVIDALKTDSQLTDIINSLAVAPNTAKAFPVGGGISVFLLVAFLLRTHFKFEGDSSKKWKILIEHKPGDNKYIASVLKKLEDWLGGRMK